MWRLSQAVGLIDPDAIDDLAAILGHDVEQVVDDLGLRARRIDPLGRPGRSVVEEGHGGLTRSAPTDPEHLTARRLDRPQGEVCPCSSRALIQEDIYESLMERASERARNLRQCNPLHTDIEVGALVSREQFDKIMSYMDIGRDEGTEVLLGGSAADLGGELAGGFYIQPTMFKGQSSMRIFQEEIFGPAQAIATVSDEAEAISIANHTEFGLGAGVWTGDFNRAHRVSRRIQAGRLWVNCYHQYPAHAALGGYKRSDIGRETHKQALDHYQQTKYQLVSYSDAPAGLFYGTAQSGKYGWQEPCSEGAMSDYRYTLGERTFVFDALADVMAKATPARSGDRLASVIASVRTGITPEVVFPGSSPNGALNGVREHANFE